MDSPLEIGRKLSQQIAEHANPRLGSNSLITLNHWIRAVGLPERCQRCSSERAGIEEYLGPQRFFIAGIGHKVAEMACLMRGPTPSQVRQRS